MFNAPNCPKCGITPFLCDCPSPPSGGPSTTRKEDLLIVGKSHGYCTFCGDDSSTITVETKLDRTRVQFCKKCLRAFRRATAPKKS
jgi:hypothetical protein